MSSFTVVTKARLTRVTAVACAIIMPATFAFSPAKAESAAKAAAGTCPKELATARIQTFEGNIINMQGLVALKKGFFRKNCLNVIAVPIVNTPASVTATLNGTVDFINSGTDNIPVARAQGIDLKIVANIASREIYSFVVRKDLVKDSYKATLEALKGKKVGVVTVGASNEFHARTHFSDEGLDPQSVTFIALGQTTTMLAGLEKGTVDAVEFFGTPQDVAVAKGFGVIVSDTRKPPAENNPVPRTLQAMAPTSLVWTAQGKFLKANPDLTARFVVGLTEASEWIRNSANREELYALMRDQVTVPSDVPNADKVYRASIDIYADMTSTKLDHKALQAWIDFATSTRDIKKKITVDELVWEAK